MEWGEERVWLLRYTAGGIRERLEHHIAFKVCVNADCEYRWLTCIWSVQGAFACDKKSY